MNFNTTEFLFIFLPVQLALFYLVPVRLRLVTLLAGSIFFYGISGDLAGFLLVVTVVWAAAVVALHARVEKNLLLFVAIVPPLAFLFLFKYLDFTLTWADPNNDLRPHFQFILGYFVPAGISFYTFQIISYLIDIRDGKIEREKNHLVFFNFATFFPQLIAGPILRYTELCDQLLFVSREKRLRPDIARGTKYIAVGLFYKIFFADILRAYQEGFSLDQQSGSLDALYSVLAYSFIIYFDFWAYSLMAIGLAALFCIDIPRNFLEPYKSLTPKDFWRRWHVTLSLWLRDYVYVKLGGNRRYAVNILIVFTACGIWHGAGWNFIIWGLYHAALVLAYHLSKKQWDALPVALQITLTFSLVTLGWPLFYLDAAGYAALLAEIFSFTSGTGETQFGLINWGYLLVLALVVFGTSEDKWLFNTEPRPVLDSPVTHAVLAFLAIMFFNYGRTFIYFQF